MFHLNNSDRRGHFKKVFKKVDLVLESLRLVKLLIISETFYLICATLLLFNIK